MAAQQFDQRCRRSEGAARAKVDEVVAAAWSARPDAQDGASGRPEGLGDVLDAERSNGASDVLWLDIEAQGQSGKVILFSKFIFVIFFTMIT